MSVDGKQENQWRKAGWCARARPEEVGSAAPIEVTACVAPASVGGTLEGRARRRTTVEALAGCGTRAGAVLAESRGRGPPAPGAAKGVRGGRQVRAAQAPGVAAAVPRVLRAGAATAGTTRTARRRPAAGEVGRRAGRVGPAPERVVRRSSRARPRPAAGRAGGRAGLWAVRGRPARGEGARRRGERDRPGAGPTRGPEAGPRRRTGGRTGRRPGAGAGRRTGGRPVRGPGAGPRRGLGRRPGRRTGGRPGWGRSVPETATTGTRLDLELRVNRT
jgi:hypothetical protein